MRFPYAVIAGFFAMPMDANDDVTALRTTTTFRRAVNLFSTISGRREYTDPGEKFENVSMMLYQPMGSDRDPWVKLVNCDTRKELSEADYFSHLRDIYNARNPHSIIDDS